MKSDIRARVGLLGGTFNPVHGGHLALAQEAQQAFSLDEVRLIPCRQPPHKPGSQLIDAEQRLQMLYLAIADHPFLSVSKIELERGGMTYTVDTLRQLHKEEPGKEWFFIIGADSLVELQGWRQIEELLTLCHFITMRRPGMPDLDTLPSAMGLPSPWPDRLLAGLFDGKLFDISSREIRRRVSAGESIETLVPAAVNQYILCNGIYR